LPVVAFIDLTAQTLRRRAKEIIILVSTDVGMTYSKNPEIHSLRLCGK
jgi:hypothetical protein